jgi:acyl-coenzyme A thioesterase PaaI-like protein
MSGNTDKKVNMETHIKTQIEKMIATETDSINSLMRPEFMECCYEEKWLTVAFPVQEWEKNRAGSMHGGIIAVAFDLATGLLTHFFIKENLAPTIKLETVFQRPVPIGDVLIIKAKINMAGKKLIHLYCEGFVKSSGKLAATATISRYSGSGDGSGE